MRYFDVPCALLLAGCVGSVAAGASGGQRVLRAATRRSGLRRREERIIRKFESEVVYIERENGWSGRETFASSVRVGSRKPILSLEDIEHFLEDVECRDGKMMLHFVDETAARDARAACHGGHGGMGGLIITSHQGCNNDGERAVYKVDDVTVTQGGVALDLAVTEALWQDAFDSVDINFGHTRYDHIYRRHSDFLRARRKRQAEDIEIPTDTPDNVLDVTLDLTSELLNTTFSAADFVTGLESFINLPVVPDMPIEIGCKNCSTWGQIVITQGAIKIDTKQIDFVPDIFDGGDDGKDVNSIITGGEFDLALTSFGARLEMFARPIKSGSYEIALFPLPVLGFVIPGIGQAGASFEPKISVDFEIEGELAVNYGIDVAVPDGAGMKITLGDLTNTTITGIKGATLKALPFTTDVTDTEIALSVAFTPTIPIGFEFSDKLSALVTVALDLPRMDAKLTPNAKTQCSLLDIGNKTKKAAVPAPENLDLSGLVLVEANMSFVVDVSADLTLPLLPAPLDSAGTTANIFSTKMPLMTSCVNPVEGVLKITQMAPAATLKADVADITAAGSTCTKHVEDKPCDCGIVTTTVYAAPPTTSAESGGPPPNPTPPPFEMTPYYPGGPTPPAGPEPPVNTPTGGVGGPHYPDGPTEPVATPTGDDGYGPGEQPPATPTGGDGYGPGEQPPSTPTGGDGYGPGEQPPATPTGGDGYGPGEQPPVTPTGGEGYGPGEQPPSTPTGGEGYGPGEQPPSTPTGGDGYGPGEQPPATPTGGDGYGPGEQPPVTPTGGEGYGPGEQPPATPTGGEGYGPGEQPPSTPTGGYVPGEDPPATSTPCTSSETIRITISTPPASAQPPATGTDNGYGNPPATTVTDIGYGNPPATDVSQPPSQSHGETPTQSQTDPTPAPPSTAQTTTAQTTLHPSTSLTMTTSTTSPPHLEESKGFMAPPSSATNATSAPATKTAPPEFTGAAVLGREVPGLRWSGAWSVGVVVGGLAFGVML